MLSQVFFHHTHRSSQSLNVWVKLHRAYASSPMSSTVAE